MTTPYTAPMYTSSGVLRGVVLATAIAGTLDLLAGFAMALTTGTSPAALLSRIAGGAIGAAALQQPVAGAWLGVLLHFIVVALMVNIYAIAAMRLPIINQAWAASGVLFGALVWVVMTCASLFPRHGQIVNPLQITLELLIGVALIGLPIAWLMKQAARWNA